MVHREKGFCQREFLCVSQYLKGKNEKGGEKKRRRRKAGNSYFHGISTIAVRIRAHYSPLLGPGLAPPRTATDGRSHNVVHTLPRVLREIRKPRELCASRDTACISCYVSGGFPWLCVLGGITERCEQRSTPSRRISAPFVQAISAKRAVDIPSTAESLNNRLTVVSLDC